jgi:hypothetical protein
MVSMLRGNVRCLTMRMRTCAELRLMPLIPTVLMISVSGPSGLANESTISSRRGGGVSPINAADFSPRSSMACSAAVVA